METWQLQSPILSIFFLGTNTGSFDAIDHIGQRGFGEIAFHGGLGRGENGVQGGQNAVADGAFVVGFFGRSGKGFGIFDGAVNFSEIDAFGRTAEAGAGPRTAAGIDQPGLLQRQQQAADNDGVGVDAAGEARGRHAIAFVIGQNGQHVDGHGKAATCSHISSYYVTLIITSVKGAGARETNAR